MKTLDPKAVEKTLLGVVTDWRELFIEHRYSKTDRSGKPWVTHHPANYHFLWSESDKIDKRDQAHFWLSLYVLPNPKIIPVVNARMTPPINQPMRSISNGIQSFHVIPWPDYGMALVTATDWNCIANPWVCFIPLEAIPEINPDNTARFTEADYPKWKTEYER